MNSNVLLRLHSISNIHELSLYQQNDGYKALVKASKMKPGEIIDLIDQSGLRGRGGAGYPTGKKMRAVTSQPEQQRYFVCNVAEGEPGSFKDHALLKNPHQVLESSAIAAYAIGAQQAFIYLRGSFVQEEKLLMKALAQAVQAGFVGQSGILPVKIIIHRGENSYIAGEETAMLESLEGKPAIPRTKPPRPYESGLWEKPTLVSNVETICNTITIVLYGPDEFRKFGTPESPGTKIFCLSGQIKKPGLYELPLGVLLSELLYIHGEGPLDGHKLVAILPGGPSTPILAVEPDIPLDFESVQKAGSHLGTAGIIVIDDSTTMLDLAENISSFFMRESCRTCPPCTIGTQETHALIQQMAEAKKPIAENIAKIKELCEMMKYRGNCAHNRSAAFSILSLLKQL
ncbi:SLBB domain-containing protein [bacterium]|nr:SLBB domain-containing protein [bacterium]